MQEIQCKTLKRAMLNPHITLFEEDILQPLREWNEYEDTLELLGEFNEQHNSIHE